MTDYESPYDNPEYVDDIELAETLSDLSGNFGYFLDVIKSLSNTKKMSVRGYALPVSSKAEVALPNSVYLRDGILKTDFEADIYGGGKAKLGRVAFQSLDVEPLKLQPVSPVEYLQSDSSPGARSDKFVSAKKVRTYLEGLEPGQKSFTWDALELAQKTAASYDATFEYIVTDEVETFFSAQAVESVNGDEATRSITLTITRPSIADTYSGTSITVIESTRSEQTAGADYLEPDADISVLFGSRSSVITEQQVGIQELEDQLCTPVSGSSITKTQLADVIEAANLLGDKHRSIGLPKPGVL